MIGNIYLGLKLLKNPSYKFSATRINSLNSLEVKDFQKLSNKEIYLGLQSNSAKYNKPFKFISWPNFHEGHLFVSPDIWGKTFSDWLETS